MAEATDWVLIYDGAGSPDIMEYRVLTYDVGPHSLIVEVEIGLQYRFQVEDPDRS